MTCQKILSFIIKFIIFISFYYKITCGFKNTLLQKCIFFLHFKLKHYTPLHYTHVAHTYSKDRSTVI